MEPVGLVPVRYAESSGGRICISPGAASLGLPSPRVRAHSQDTTHGLTASNSRLPTTHNTDSGDRSTPTTGQAGGSSPQPGSGPVVTGSDASGGAQPCGRALGWVCALLGLFCLDFTLALFVAWSSGGGGSVRGQLSSYSSYKVMGDVTADVAAAVLARACLTAVAAGVGIAAGARAAVREAADGVTLAGLAFLLAKAYARVRFSRAEGAADDASFWLAVVIGAVVAVSEAVVCRKAFAACGDSSAPARPRSAKPQLHAITSLRFVAAAHIVMYHFNKGDRSVAELDLGHDTWNLFCNWGGAQLTFFFSLSGFILAYQYGDRKTIPQSDFWFRRFARLYPLYMATFIAGLAMASDVPRKVVTSMLFCVQVWVDGAFDNQVNVPAWAVGPFLMLYAVFPTLVQVLATASTRLRWRLLGLFWGFSCLGAGNAMGYNWTGIYGPVCHVLFAAHTPAFVFGTALGLNYLDSTKARLEGSEKQSLLDAESGDGPSSPRRSAVSRAADLVGAPVFAAALALIMCLYNPFTGPAFPAAWAPNGMLLPVFGGLTWFAARAEDPLSKVLGAAPLRYLGGVSFTVYLVQAPTRQALVNHFGMNPAHWDADAGVFVPLLLAVSFVAYHFVEVPAGKAVMKGYATVCEGCVSRRTSAPDDAEGNAACMPGIHDAVKTVGYYLLFVAIVGGYVLLSLDHSITRWGQWDSMLSVRGKEAADHFIDGFKWLALASMPALLFTTIGHLCIPPSCRVKTPSIADMLDEKLAGVPHMRHKLHFRIVTRGLHPLLVAENVVAASEVLEACLPAHKYELEVVADNPMDLQTVVNRKTHPKMHPVTEITVPKGYVTREVDPAKYKARALNYAIENSSAAGVDGDWIIHLDEETQFSVGTVQRILHHCACEEEAVAAGERADEGSFERIGQGPILYGANDVTPEGTNNIENWLTTLADSIRVADDFGKFRLQYWFHEPLIGMHGSFVVASQRVEAATTFNHGMIGSITEDAYFSLVARAKGVRFSWVDAFMFEQSPFSVVDFAKQRKRWFAGLLLVCISPEIPRRLRATLGFMVLTWAFTPMVVLAMLLCVLVGSDVATSFRVLLSVVAAVSCWGYMLGFVWTFSPSRGGWVRYIVLGFFQWILQPFFAFMEIWGVAWALVDRSAYTGFHIVKKESKNLQARQAAGPAAV